MTQPAAESSNGAALTADALAAELLLQFTQAEQDLLAQFARIAELRDTLAMLLALRAAARRTADQIRAQLPQLTQDITAAAADQAERDATRQLAGAPPAPPTRPTFPAAGQTGGGRHRTPLLASLPPARRNPVGRDLAARLETVLPRFLRFADDAYRAATLEAVTPLLARQGTGQLAQQAAWRHLTERGITGFVDRSGRRWNLASYVEMATRTAVVRAYNTEHLARLTAAGVTRFTVPGDGHPCPLCRPWEGVTLTVDGPGPTIGDATTAGLFHPNCRHTLAPQIPGRTTPTPARQWTDADQARYDATQGLRALEREVRRHKRAALGAVTDLDRRRANVRVRATQARIRAHVDRHDLVRRTRREQLDLGNR